MCKKDEVVEKVHEGLLRVGERGLKENRIISFYKDL